MAVLGFFVAHWYLSLFSQTFFHHRYAAHRMFDMSKVWEKFFFVFSYITQGSSYLSPKVYGILHRLHHAHADTEDDPHSPKYEKNLFTMMWSTRAVYNNILRGRSKIESKYLKELPDWKGFDLWGNNLISRILWVGVYITFYVFFATHWWMYLLIPIHIVMGPFHGVIINWFAHKYGYTNFEVSDTSKNFLPFDFLMLGESYHNNHHRFGNKPNFGFRWHEIDPTYLMIRLFSFLGIIKMRPVRA